MISQQTIDKKAGAIRGLTDDPDIQAQLLEQWRRAQEAAKRKPKPAKNAAQAVLKVVPGVEGDETYRQFMADRDKETAAEIARMKREGEQQARQTAVEKKLDRSGIPKRYETASFAEYAVSQEAQGKALKVIQGYAERFGGVLRNGTCMAWVGNPGTGKTHLACATMRTVIESGHSAMMMSALMAVGYVFDSFGDNRRSRQDAVNTLCEPDLLVLDEVGELSASEGEVRWFFEIMNSRYNAMRPTILISNQSQGKMERLLRPKGIDRLTESGGMILDFSWESHRPSTGFRE